MKASFETEWYKLCDEVIEYAKDTPPGALVRYAASYAKGGKQLSKREDIGDQITYILSNMAGCRGPKAKDLKERLKIFRGECDAG